VARNPDFLLCCIDAGLVEQIVQNIGLFWIELAPAFWFGSAILFTTYAVIVFGLFHTSCIAPITSQW
jgi:hypothetical protein